MHGSWPTSASMEQLLLRALQNIPNCALHDPILELSVYPTEGKGSSSGIGIGVASNGWQLLLLALNAQAALGGEMHAPHHVMFTPVERVLAHLLGLLVTIFGRDIYPRLVLLLPDLVAPVCISCNL